jgi:hypothetical protein
VATGAIRFIKGLATVHLRLAEKALLRGFRVIGCGTGRNGGRSPNKERYFIHGRYPGEMRRDIGHSGS